jgi:riboflavin kinase
MRPDGPRDPVAGPDRGPESPYPIRLSGPVIKGFGRGSKEVCMKSLHFSFFFFFFCLNSLLWER